LVYIIIDKAGFLGAITRLRVELASLRDPPKPRGIYIYSSRVPVKGPEAKLKGGCEGEGAFAGTC